MFAVTSTLSPQQKQLTDEKLQIKEIEQGEGQYYTA
jgi:hypothetical protein